MKDGKEIQINTLDEDLVDYVSAILDIFEQLNH